MGTEKEITNASTGVTPEELGGSGPSTDLNAKDFPPGTTSVTDGVPTNIKGHVVSGAPAGDQPPQFDPNMMVPAKQQAAPQGGEQPPQFDPNMMVPESPRVVARKDAWNQAGKQPEQPGTIQKLWDFVNRGLVKPETINKILEKGTAPGEHKVGDIVHIPGFGDIDAGVFDRGVRDSASGILSSFSSPLSIALLGAGPLAKAVPAIAPTVHAVGALAGVGFGGQGAVQVLTPRQEGESEADALERRLSGASQVFMSAAGAKGTKADVSVGEAAHNVGEAVKGGASAVAGATADAFHDVYSGAKQAITLGKAPTFDEAIRRISPPSKGRAPEYLKSVKNVSQDLQAIVNKNPVAMEDPEALTAAIQQHIDLQNNELQRRANATMGDRAPVVPDIEQRLDAALDDFARKKAGNLGTDAQVDAAKQQIKEQFTRVHDEGNGLTSNRMVNLHEAENLRKKLNTDGQPQFATNANPTSDAYKLMSQHIAEDVLRPAIDERYTTEGVDNVKESRQKMADLIEVKDQIIKAQQQAIAQGKPGIVKSILKKVGTPAGLLAVLGGTLGPHGILGVGALLLGDRIGDNLRNPNANMDRAIDLAAKNPNAQATEIDTTRANNPAPTTPATPQAQFAANNPGSNVTTTPSSFQPTSGPIVPPPPTPPVREPAPPNHDLHAALATYYDLPADTTSEAASLDSLKQRFYEAGRKIANGEIKLTPEQADARAKMLDTINKATAKDRQISADNYAKAKEKYEADKAKYDADQQKAAEKAAADQKKEAEKAAAKAEAAQIEKDKILEERKAKEDKEGQKTIEDVKKEIEEHLKAQEEKKRANLAGEEVEEEPKKPGRESLLGNTTRVIHGEGESFADQQVQRSPKENLHGHSDVSAQGHEWGHTARYAMEGLLAGDISTHLHPDSGPTTYGGVERVSRPYVENPNDTHTTDERLENTLAHVRGIMAGGVVNELLHQIPIEENAGMGNDMQQAKAWLKEHGIEGKDADVAIQDAINDVREGFQKHPQVLEAIQHNQHVRERGLSSTQHASKERVRNFQQHVKEIVHANENPEPNGENNPSDQGKRERGGEGKVRKANEKENSGANEGKEVNRSEVGGEKDEHQVIDRQTGDVMSTHVDRKMAQRRADKLDSEYGGVRYKVERATPRVRAEVANNASGESAASQEAINRQASEKAQGVKRYRIDTRSGREIPLIGPDAVDAKAGPYDRIVQRDAAGRDTTLDEGVSARPARSKLDAAKVPTERTTGDEKVDKAIKDAGGVPGGVMPSFEYPDKVTGEKRTYPALSIFHDPQSGTSLNLPMDQTTPEAVKAHLEASRAQYAAAAEKAGKSPANAEGGNRSNLGSQKVLEGIKKTYGESEDASDLKGGGAAFITPEGKFIHLSSGDTHQDAIAGHGGEKVGPKNGYDNRPKFLDETGAVRLHNSTERKGETLAISVPKQGVNPEQVAAIEKAVAQGVSRNGNVRIERSDANSENHTTASAEKDFPRSGDATAMLKKIGAHPQGERSNLDADAMKGFAEASRETQKPAERDEQFAAHEANGGSTFSPEGENMSGKDLHSVASTKNSKVVDKFTPEILNAYKAEHPGQNIGTWKDPETGKTWLDTPTTIADREEAIAAGKAGNQKSIYHLGTGETIPTGGTGEAPKIEQSNLTKEENPLKFGGHSNGWITNDGKFESLKDGREEHYEAANRLGLIDSDSRGSKFGGDEAVQEALDSGHVRVIGGEGNPEFEAGKNNAKTRKLISDAIKANPQIYSTAVEFRQPYSYTGPLTPEKALSTIEQSNRKAALRTDSEGTDNTPTAQRSNLGKEEKHPISEKLVEKFGTTDKPNTTGFLLPDGRISPLKPGTEHVDALREATGQPTNRDQFINKEGTVRQRFSGSLSAFTVPDSGVSEAQAGKMKAAVDAHNGKIVMLDVAGDPTKSAEGTSSKDIDQMLQKVGAQRSNLDAVKYDTTTHPHLPQDMIDDMQPDELETLKGKPTLQKNVVKEFNKIDPSIDEIVNAAKAGKALGGWWDRFIKTFKAMGEPTEAADIEQLGPAHEEALKAFHGALSGNKAVEHANKLAWNAYRDWLDMGRPKDRASINQIIAQNGKAKGVAAISDTHENGKVIHEGLDTTKLTKLVNSPQMRDVNPVPFTGNAFLDSPVEGVSSGAKKIPSMVATTAGEGNLQRVVFDTHMKDVYGQLGLTDAKYIADSIHLRRAAKEMGLQPGEAQEQIWGTVLALKSLLKEGLSPEEVAEQFGDEHVGAVSKDYAQVILNQLEEDPSFRETLDGLSKHGFNPTSPKAIARLKEIVAEGQSRLGQTDPASINRELLAKSAERLGAGMKDYNVQEAREAPAFNFGANESKTKSALDTISGKK